MFKSKKIFSLVIALLFALVFISSFSAGVLAAEDDYTIVTVVKHSGSAWFERMKVGVNEFAEETGLDAYQLGPSSADVALQVEMIENLIAQEVDAICVVPNAVEGLEPVLKKAREAGIVVISHEGTGLENVDYDVEAFSNEAYGAHFIDLLAERMDEQGKYVPFVGSLTSRTHNIWVDSAIKKQEKEYPEMELATERVSSEEDQSVAYRKTKELLRTYPELKGIIGSASIDVPGAGQALEELGLEDEVTVVGTSVVSVAGPYLKTGAIDVISFWDPKLAGYVMNKVAVEVLEGNKIEQGHDFGVEGYENVNVHPDEKLIEGEAWIDVTKENMDQYNF